MGLGWSGGLGPQPLSDFDLQGLEHLRVRIRIEAEHAGPVPGKAQHTLLSRGGAKQHANIDELVLYRIRHITDELKLALFPLRHVPLS